MHGLHLTADLHGCAAGRALMIDPAALRATCLAAVEAAGLTAVAELFHRFPLPATGRGIASDRAVLPSDQRETGAPAGITGVVLLAESHLAVHTWPELGAATLDVYVCNFGRDHSAAAHALLDALVAAFAPTEVERHALERGALAVDAE